MVHGLNSSLAIVDVLSAAIRVQVKIGVEVMCPSPSPSPNAIAIVASTLNSLSSGPGMVIDGNGLATGQDLLDALSEEGSMLPVDMEQIDAKWEDRGWQVVQLNSSDP